MKDSFLWGMILTGVGMCAIIILAIERGVM
jgi:hypothetical protein